MCVLETFEFSELCCLAGGKERERERVWEWFAQMVDFWVCYCFMWSRYMNSLHWRVTLKKLCWKLFNFFSDVEIHSVHTIQLHDVVAYTKLLRLHPFVENKFDEIQEYELYMMSWNWLRVREGRRQIATLPDMRLGQKFSLIRSCKGRFGGTRKGQCFRSGPFQD